MKKFLKTFDGLWALPLAFVVFVFAGDVLQEIGGFGTGTYDLAFFQPLFLATAIVIGVTNAVVWGLWFTFRDFHKQIYSRTGRTEFSKLNDKFKIVVSLSVFFLMFFAIIIVYLKLI
ncbi:MAG: hypothetical protein LC112_13830 [Flavobacteriales bacterium]|nr:hypothetical protein [Flavobacteriales bacterium]